MSTNGKANGHCNGGPDMLQWKVGLLSSERKYLTAETFGFEVNGNGQALKKKQTWMLEQDKSGDETQEVVYIKSHLGRYLTSDKYGKITCDTPADELDVNDNSFKFVVEYATDGSGRWAFRSLEYGCYLGRNSDTVVCFSKTMACNELWVVQLAIHPQINLRHISRKRYAVLCDDEIQCKELIPWGEAGLIILHFIDRKEDWKYGYSLKTCDNRFLHRDGSLVNELEDNAKFTLEIKNGGLAFRDINGYYLTAVGSTATMKSGKNKSVPGKDDLFSLENSHPQVVVESLHTGKLVSVKQGVDLSANQDEVCEKSTFQMEYDTKSKKWSFRTCVDNKYWSQENFGGIQAASMAMSDTSLFTVDSKGDGTVTITAPNGRSLYNKQTGSMLCNLDNPDSKNFVIRMVNRPFLILKSDFGFVGVKSKNELTCSKTFYEVTYLEAINKEGYYYLKGNNNKYWTVADDCSLRADGDTPSCKFLLEFQGRGLMSIKAPNGKYLKGEQNSFLAKGEQLDATTLWEY